MLEGILELLTSWRDSSIAQLRQLDKSTLTQALKRVFDDNQAKGWADFDELDRIGRILRHAEQNELEAFVEQWLLGFPNALRLDISSSFLSGYWSTHGAVSETLLRSIVTQLHLHECDTPCRDSALTAVCSVIASSASPEAKALARNTLSAYLQRADILGIQYGVVETIRSTLQAHQ